MIISLLHPSRGRAHLALQTATYWYNRIGGDINNVEYILSVDLSDPKQDEYINTFNSIPFSKKKLFVSENDTVVQATNIAARESTGDILIYLSDDFHCPSNWDELVKSKINNRIPILLKVDDCYQRFDKDVLTIPIMNRRLYERLGYFWYPEYRSMFVDQDLYWVAKHLGAIVLAPELKFEHMHPVAGKGKHDETYQRSTLNWDQGKALYHRRQQTGFK